MPADGYIFEDSRIEFRFKHMLTVVTQKQFEYDNH